MDFMKKNYSKIFGGAFIISLLWVLGRTGAKFLTYGMNENFVTGAWKNCFMYSTIDKFFIILAQVMLSFYIISRIERKKH